MITIVFGWWLLPTLISIGAFTWHWYQHRNEGRTYDYARIGQAVGQAITFGVALCVSLIAWLIWALVF